MKQVIITVNGPGEISAWLTPLSRAIKAASPETRVLACLMPCVFSSGTERAAVERIGTVDAVAGISESFGLIFRKRFPPGFEPGAETLVLHLGGELVLSHLLARRIGAPAFAYVEHPAPILKRFERVFYNGLNPMPERIGRRGTEPVGEMMVDAALAKLGVGGRAAREPKTVAIFAGSRDYMAGFLLPYFAEAADRIAAIRPDISFVLPKSDYIADAWYCDFPAPEANRDWRASAVTHHAGDGAEWFETSAGTRIEAVSNGEVLKRAAVALTLPGTNTGELGAAGIPMVTVVPTYRRCAEAVPLPGLAGHVTRIPLIGNEIKVFAAGLALKKKRILSIPSRRTGRTITPELIGRDLHDTICREVIALVDDATEASARVREAMGPPGAAERLAGEILARLGTAPEGAPPGLDTAARTA